MTLVLLAVLIGLGGIYFLSQNKAIEKSTIRLEDREFVTKNKEDVHTITIEAPARPMIHLSRMGSDWYVNRKHKVRKNIMDNMLIALTRMNIKYIPMSKENDTALERMKKFGLDIKTYDGDGEILTEFTLGTNTNDEYGTYAINKGAEQVYVMSISSHEGGLRNYFTHSVRDFRNLTLLDIKSDDLDAISLEYPKDLANSMVLSRDGNGYQLNSANSKEMAVNDNIAEAFFSSIKSVNAESLMNNFIKKDTIIGMVPFMKINFDFKEKTDKWITIYPFVDLESSYNTRSAGDVTKRHNNYFVNTSWGDFYKVQDRFLKKFFVTPEYFTQN